MNVGEYRELIFTQPTAITIQHEWYYFYTLDDRTYMCFTTNECDSKSMKYLFTNTEPGGLEHMETLDYVIRVVEYLKSMRQF